VTFNDGSDYWLDAVVLTQPLESGSVEAITAVVELYKGELLPGFYDEWVGLERDRLGAAYHQKMNLLLDRLIRDGRWDQALDWSERWIQLGHSPEPAFRALMSAHAGLGDQAMVSAAYQRCRETLNRELGLDPSPETQGLFERILKGEFPKPAHSPSPPRTPPLELPAFLLGAEAYPTEQPGFVGRDQELARLEAHLQKAMGGSGRIAFVTGEAGSGKTALLQEFTQSAQEAHPDLVIAGGNCNAHTGIGDPYLPFREILELLAGDVEARWAAGAISRDHATRLWDNLPVAAQALVKVGPDLVDTFVPVHGLVERCKASVPYGVDWLVQLEKRSQRLLSDVDAPIPGQKDVFEQYARVLQHLSRQVPIVIIVDDLQWADLESINLLFHLGRSLSGCRMLVLGAYRPEEVALGRIWLSTWTSLKTAI